LLQIYDDASGVFTLATSTAKHAIRQVLNSHWLSFFGRRFCD